MKIPRMHIAGSGRQRGVTLVELMVAMLISLLLMAGVAQVFSSSSKAYRVHEALSRIQENGRFAMEFLARDIRMADFWGCANRVSKVVNNLSPPSSGTQPWQYSFGTGGVVGTEGNGLNNSDSVILRGAFGTGINVVPPFGPQQSSTIFVTSPNDLSDGDIVIVSDCESADVFQITSGNPGLNGTIVHNTGTGNPGNDGNVNASPANCSQANNHCLSKIYAGDAQIYRARSIAYSVAASTTGTGQPALIRDDGINPALELVDGVAGLQILYGEDLDTPGNAGFGTADYYVPADSVTDMENVVSLKISLLLQSYEDNLTDSPMTYNFNGGNVTAGDNRLYQVFNSTVTVRNRVQ